LNKKNKKQLFVPKGFAHGFLVISKEAIVHYKVDNIYNPEYESGIIYNDSHLKIDWKKPSNEIFLSQKDKMLSSINIRF